MAIDENEEKRRLRSGIIYTILTLGLVLLLITPITILLLDEEAGGPGYVPYEKDDNLVSGDMSMDEGSRLLWEEFLSSAPTIEVAVNQVDPDVEMRELDRITSLPDDVQENSDGYNNDSDQPSSWKSRDQGDDDDIALDSETEAPATDGGSREVEESDIVKVNGDRMYVLNTYLGLVVINLEDPADPYIEGRSALVGRPVSMYVVDFLGFVIVSDIPSEIRGDGWNNGRMYIVDLTYPSDPRVVQYVDIEGYPVDSRRVGEVIYVISNEQPNYYFDIIDWGIGMDIAVEEAEGETESQQKTHILSIGFYDPNSLGLIEEVEIEGNSGKIHASQYAIFIPQDSGDWDDPRTEFTYVDISDPEGDVRIRGDIVVDGYLRDRFQMDHYGGMFRVVTQENPTWDGEDVFPSSTLRVIDARNPDEMEEISSLLIDDEGNLMATRFAGERAYTIHLPEVIDPLDVIDLTNPADPELTDILEIPGWVEHLEVIGEKIIAVGVDNEEERKVALYFFDVTDPYNAELTDRVVIGEGYTYSQANWDEKALTVIPEEGLVALPFTSYDWEKYSGQVNGLQFISFDLGSGDLEEKGMIEQMGQISRSRLVNGYMVATSENLLQTIDISDLDEPVVKGIVELARDHRDAFLSDGRLVTLVQPPYGSSGARIEVSSLSDPLGKDISIGPEGLEFESFQREGVNVYIKGIRQGEGHPVPMVEVHRYDMSDPLSPLHYRVASMEVPASDAYSYYERYDMETKEEGQSSWTLYYDPTILSILDVDEVVVYSSYGYKAYWMENGESDQADRLAHISWITKDQVSILYASLPSEINIYGVYKGSSDAVLVETYQYPYGYDLIELEFHDNGSSIKNNYSVKGDVIGVSSDGYKVYTTLSYYWDRGYNSTLNVYDISTGKAVLVDGINIDAPGYSPLINDGRIMFVSTYYGYYGRYGYPEDDVVYDTDDEAVEVERSRDEEYTPETVIHVIELKDGLIDAHTTITIDGSYYSQLSLEDMIVLQSGSEHVAVEIGNDGSYRTFEWWSAGWASGGDVEGDLAVISMGLYGIETIDL